jgi:hypothetical protein
MSYDIFYRKQFIKVSETEVIPFFESGSNNCYECGTRNRVGKRSRSWENRRIYGKTIVQHYEVAEYIRTTENNLIESGIESRNKYNDESYIYNPNNFGYHSSLSINGKSTHKTTFSDYRNYYINGIKKAITIEELVENNIIVSLVVSPYSKEKIEKANLEMKPIVHFNTTQQLINTISEYTKYYINVPGCFYLTTVSGYAIDRLLKKNSTKRVKKEKQLVTLKEYYIIKCPNDGILAKLTRYGYRYSFKISNSCKIFASLKQAESYVKRINRPNFSVLKGSDEISVYL